MLIRKHIGLGKLIDVIQPDNERILDIVFEARSELGDVAQKHLIAEIMGRNSNIILCDEDYVILGMAKPGGDITSIRPLLTGMKYEFPPKKAEVFECDYMETIDVSADIEWFFADRAKHEYQNQISRGLIASIEQKKKTAVNKLGKLGKELDATKDREEDRLFGELLTANIYRLQQGNSAEVDNYYTNEKVKIPLDRLLTPSQNATRYYKQYEKKKRAEEFITKQIEKTQEEIDYLESVGLSLSLAETYADFEAIRQELGIKRAAKRQAQNNAKLKPALVIDGFDIYVGKNNMQNDYLTMKFAQNMDVWMHIQKQPGCHVLIRTNGREVPDKVLVSAASLAKENSKAKDENKAIIDYCLAKFVKKPNGVKPGFVIYSEFKSIIV